MKVKFKRLHKGEYIVTKGKTIIGYLSRKDNGTGWYVKIAKDKYGNSYETYREAKETTLQNIKGYIDTGQVLFIACLGFVVVISLMVAAIF